MKSELPTGTPPVACVVAVLPTRQLRAPRARVPANPQTPPSRGSSEIAEHPSHRTEAVEAGAGPPRFRGRGGAPHLSVSKDLEAARNHQAAAGRSPAHAQGPSPLLGGAGQGTTGGGAHPPPPLSRGQDGTCSLFLLQPWLLRKLLGRSAAAGCPGTGLRHKRSVITMTVRDQSVNQL